MEVFLSGSTEVYDPRERLLVYQ